MGAGRLDDPLDEVARVEELAAQLEVADVELVREQDVVDDPPEPLRLLDDQRDEPLAARLVEREVVAAQRLGGAVDGRERRAELVRGGGDELGLQLLEPARLGEVPEREHRPVEELDPGHGDPALAVLRLERDGLRLHRLGPADGDPFRHALPVGDDVCGLRADHRAGFEARDRLHRRVPEADDSAPVDEEDAVGHVRKHVRGVRALLHLLVQPCVVHGEADEEREMLGEAEIVGAVRPAVLPGDEGDRAQDAAAGCYGDANAGLGEDSVARLDRLDGDCLGLRLRGPGGGIGVSASRDGPHGRSLLVHEVDHAPGGEALRQVLCGPPQAGVPLQGPGEPEAGPCQQVELHLPLDRLGDGRALGGAQALPLEPGLLLGADVVEVSLHVVRLAVAPAHGGGLVAHPDNASVPAEHAVLADERRRSFRGAVDLLPDPGSVVLVDEVEEEPSVGEPVLGAVAEHRPDLRAHVDELLAVPDLVDVGRPRKLLRQRVVAGFELVLFLPGMDALGDVRSDEDGAARAHLVAHRRPGQANDAAGAVAPLVRKLDIGHALAAAHLFDDGAGRVTSFSWGDQIRKLAPVRLSSRVPVEVLGPLAPGADRSVRFEADDRVARRSAERAEPIAEDLVLVRSSSQPRREEAGRSRCPEPRRERDEVPPRLLRDEEEVERPADGRDQEARPEAAHGAREHGDQNPDRRRQDDGVEARRAEGHADARLEGCSEDCGDDATKPGRLPQPHERWTICGPTHHT